MPTAKILLAEDNIISQRVAQRMLDKLGYTVDIVTDGAEAVKRLCETTYGLALMDCQMPLLDGFAATRAVRLFETQTQRPPVTIIGFTAHAMDGDRERCLAAGMNDYLAKPVNRADLADTLKRYFPAPSSDP